MPIKIKFTLTGLFPGTPPFRRPQLTQPWPANLPRTCAHWLQLELSRSQHLAGPQAPEKRDSSSLSTKKGKVCVASGFPEKYSHRMVQLCGLAPSTTLGGRPLVAAMHLSPEGALVPASPDWLWLLGVNSQVCMKDTPAGLETIKSC